MGKRTENSTTYGPVGNNNKRKCFKFHVRWTFVLESGKAVLIEKDVVETCNIGRLVEDAFDRISDEFSVHFVNDEVKIEVKEEEVSLEEESDEHGHMSASSIDSGNRNQGSNAEAKNAPIELGMRRYSYDVFMKRVQGPETYYHIDRDKSVRENLMGKVIVEYPEFIVAHPAVSHEYFEKQTSAVDYRRGQKAPTRPSAQKDEPKNKSQVAGENEKGERSNLYNWKGGKGGKKPKFNSTVDLSKTELKEWQKEALKRANQNDRTEFPVMPAVTPIPRDIPAPSPQKKMKTEEEKKRDAAERQRALQSAMKFFDTNQISSDDEEEEDD